MKPHDLHSHMAEVTAVLAHRYERIRARSAQDPGTAGDSGEEDWAALLRDWLPASYHVVTKGRLLAHDGSASGQVDVLVLRPSYPPALRDTKHYLLSGLAAAFECKVTLRAEHLRGAAERCKDVKRLAGAQETGSPWKELRGEPVFGLLAHSHSWKGAASSPQDNVTNGLLRCLEDVVDHPREMLDLVCIADLATWHSSVVTAMPKALGEQWTAVRQAHGYPEEGGISGVVFDQSPHGEILDWLPAPVAVVLVTLYERLAQTDPSMRPIADYFRMAYLYGSGAARGRVWPLTVLSEDVQRRLRDGPISEDEAGQWGEWRQMFF
ncbi:MAG TPA: DUF6602 domain-containing protein [Acidimicrobiales bacterium]